MAPAPRSAAERGGGRRRLRAVPVFAALLATLLSGPAGCAAGPGGDHSPAAGDPSVSVPTGPYAARLPRFPAPPTPEPVTVPDGPLAGWYSRIPTGQPVAFLTIDDGWIRKSEARQLLVDAHVPVTLFLTTDAIRDDPGFFRGLPENVVIEAHTVTHQVLRGKPYATQRREICGSADELAAWYGRRPVLFRPPGGSRDDTTLRATRDCGLKAAFLWKETVDKGRVRYQTTEHRVQAGDIILMHFRERFVDDFTAALTAMHQAGLTPALLEDYLR
ncbi:polysaccharide deacetylase family protein [Plantactinospora sp. B5E13]|uniref:polysaccharide deacetylase family protein n=1 Tax=unclassified Plantactinospora TaxID=2631981 RepID=UPI00325C4EA9